MKWISRILWVVGYCVASLNVMAAPSAASDYARDLDLSIHYYNKVVTPEGVTRESRYEEKMLRRAGHVWVARVLQSQVAPHDAHDAVEHKHFNPTLIPRHVQREGTSLRVEYVDAHDQAVVEIPPSDYENVNFDGSWENAFYLIDPRWVNALPTSSRSSNVPGARWREREQAGVFQRVLWDDGKQIALRIESGNRAGTFYRRIDVTPAPGLTAVLPWQGLNGYARKTYSDYLD